MAGQAYRADRRFVNIHKGLRRLPHPRERTRFRAGMGRALLLTLEFDGSAFFNMALGLDTDWTPEELDRWLHALEDREGRRRDVERYSSRTLDIDIILFGDLIVCGPGHLEIPRDELKHAFVLAPLAEIAPYARHPQSGKSMAELWQAHAQSGAVLELVGLD